MHKTKIVAFIFVVSSCYHFSLSKPRPSRREGGQRSSTRRLISNVQASLISYIIKGDNYVEAGFYTLHEQ